MPPNSQKNNRNAAAAGAKASDHLGNAGYTLDFEDLEDGRFQKLSGRFDGEQFAVGQNSLDPTEELLGTFGRDLTGQRITRR